MLAGAQAGSKLNRLAEWPETCPEQLAYRSEDFGQDATPGLIAYMPRVCLLEKPEKTSLEARSASAA